MMMLWCSAVLGFVARVLEKMPVQGFVFINIIIIIIITITIIIIIDIININVTLKGVSKASFANKKVFWNTNKSFFKNKGFLVNKKY